MLRTADGMKVPLLGCALWSLQGLELEVTPAYYLNMFRFDIKCIAETLQDGVEAPSVLGRHLKHRRHPLGGQQSSWILCIPAPGSRTVGAQQRTASHAPLRA